MSLSIFPPHFLLAARGSAHTTGSGRLSVYMSESAARIAEASDPVEAAAEQREATTGGSKKKKEKKVMVLALSSAP